MYVNVKISKFLGVTRWVQIIVNIFSNSWPIDVVDVSILSQLNRHLFHDVIMTSFSLVTAARDQKHQNLHIF